NLMQDIVEASGRRKRLYPAALREIFAVLISSVYAAAYKRAMIIQRLSTKISGGVRGVIENIKEVTANNYSEDPATHSDIMKSIRDEGGDGDVATKEEGGVRLWYGSSGGDEVVSSVA
ncbi:hypothetical protein Tco_1358789, partial [Tanacetum coccineum]